jgi:pimeloyl-ACP methyl ester carboxylesterase
MKLALLLPGYLDSPDYLHMKTFEKRLKELSYTVERLDPCNLWKTDDVNNYSITNYIKQVKERVDVYKDQNPEEIILIGHSMGGFTAIIVGNRINEVTKIVSLCPPPDRHGSLEEWKGTGFRHSKRDLPEDPKKFRIFDIPYSFAEDGLQYSALEEVKKSHKSLMIFIALDDVIVPPELTEEIVKNANSPYVVRQEKMGHDFRFSQEECNIVMTKIEEFLKL